VNELLAEVRVGAATEAKADKLVAQLKKLLQGAPEQQVRANRIP
jgi:hypothetical protein